MVMTASQSYSWETSLPNIRQENNPNYFFSKRQVVPVLKGTSSKLSSWLSKHSSSNSERALDWKVQKKGVKWPKSFTRWPWVPWRLLRKSSFKDSKWLWDEKQLSDNTISFPTSDSLQVWVYLVISDETCQYFLCFSNLSHCNSFGVLWLWRRVREWVGAGWLSEKAGSMMWQEIKWIQTV